MNSEGSALAENEKYLDSIQGKTDILSNSMQTLWNNTLSSDFIKILLDIANGFVKAADGAGLLNTALAAIAASSIFKKDKDGDQSIISELLSIFKYDDNTGTIGKNTSSLFAQIAAKAKDAGGGISGLVTAIKGYNIGAKAATIGTQLLNSALISLGAVIAGIVISKVISWVYDLATAQERAADRAKEAVNTYRETQETLKQHKQTINEVSAAYEKLSGGVDPLTNENMTLTTKSYEEYLDICNDIAEMYPELVTGYDAQGNAILSLKGNVDQLTQAYKNAAQASRQQMISSGDDIFSTFKNKYENKNKWAWEESGLSKQVDIAQKMLDVIYSGDKDKIKNVYWDVLQKEDWATTKDMYDAAGIDGNWLNRGEFLDFWTSEADVDKMINEVGPKLRSFIKSTTNQINTETSKVISLMDAYLGEDFDYVGLSDRSRAYVDQIVSSLDAKFVNGFESADALYNYIKTNIVDVFKDPSVVNAVSSLTDLQLKFNKGSISYKDYKDQLSDILFSIENKVDDNTLDQIKIGVGIDEKSLQTSFQHAIEIIGDDAQGINLNKLWSLSVEDLKIAGQIEVPDGVTLSWEELLKAIEDVKIAATSDFDIANYTEAISNHSAVISEYQEAIQKLGKGSFTMDDFMDLIKKYPDLAKGVDVSSNAFYGLSRNLNRAIKTSTKSFTNDLKELRNSLVAAGKSTDSIDQLIDAINNMPDDALDDIIQKYSTLAEKIQEAKTSQDKLLASMEENPNEGYETRGEALEYMKEAMEKGEIGSESNLWNVAEKYGFTYDSAKTINENADALAKFIAIRERWYKIKDDGDGRTKDGYSYEGTENFIKDVETAVKNNAKLQEYLAWDYDENTGVLNFDYNNQDWDTIVSILSETKELAGLTSDEFADFMIQVGQYFGIDWGNYDDVLSHLNAIATGSSDAKTKVEEYGQAMQDYFGENSDVDLTARPMVKFDSTNFADWEKLYQEIIENPDGHSEEDVKNAQEQLAAIQKGDSYATVYSSTFSNDDGTKSVVVTPILPDGKVLSPEQLEQYADKLLAGEELDPGVDIKLAEFDGSNSIQKANEYAKALHEAQAEYDTLRDTLNINTIIDEKGIEGLTEIENKELQNSINTKSDGTVVIDEEAFRSALSEAEYTEDQIDILIDKIKKLNSEAFNIDPFNIDETLISEGIHGLKEIQDLQGAIKEDAITGLTVVDADAFTSVLTEAGYTEQQIDSLIQKIKEYGNVVITSGNNDPLGLNATNMSIDTIKASLNTLGVEFTETYGRLGDGLKDININIPDLVSTLKASGWTDEAIKSYCAKLSEANIEGFQIKVNSEEVDNAIEKANEVPEEENTTYTVNGTGLQTLKDIKTAADNIPTSITTTHTTEEITVKKTVNEDEGFNLFKPSTWFANGTAHVQGSAFNTGSWGASKTETALVGELGPELLVRDGRWTTIGENGAEFTGIKKGDIIFNHKQTEELLKNGYVTSRGKAYASGTAYAAGGGTFARYEFSGSGGYVKYDVNDKAVDKYGDISGSIKKATAAADEFEDVIDWIEIRIEEINEQLDLMNAQLENAVGYSSKNNIIDQMLGVNNIKFGNLMAGIERYTEYISGLLTKIPAQYQEAAQNGAIAITEFAGKADEATVEAINNYREWAQKVADLKQQLEEVKTEIQDLAKQKFDNVSDEYDNIISLIESANEKLDAQVSLMEDSGYVASKKYYESMVENTKKQNEELEKEKVALQSVFDEQVKLGNIKVGSEAWYEMVGALYEVDLSIMECSSELESFQNAINDIYWDNFDQLINRLDYLKDETQGLIDLMDSDDMVADPQKRKYENGTVEYWTADDVAWTDEGLASLGLYAQQMEIAEYKSRQYAQAIDDLTKDFNDGKYSENEYLEKLNELTNAQYDSIESYYEAQDAIKDLNETRIDSIKNGIEKEIEAYEELIEKQKEELNAEKDLHDFQKSIAEQEKNISDIKRKLAAIENDNSISAAAQRKKLQAELAEAEYELEEMYYDRSVEDKNTALDKELESFQEEKNAEITKWEEYLDNVETVVADSLTLIQANASGIYDTLNAKANEYDLTLSDAILTPWQDGALAVSDYQETFDTAASSTMDQLEGIRLKWQEIIDTMNEAAKADIAANNKANASYVSAKNPTVTTKPSTTTTNKPTSSQQAPSSSSGPAVGSSVTVKGSATHFSGNSGGVKMASFVPGGSYEVYQVSGSQVLIGRGGVYTGWVNKSDLVGYAKGTTGVKENQLAWIDELGEELIIRPQNGRMAFLEKGTGVVPADLTANLMEWGKLDPSIMLEQNRPVVSAPQVINNNMEISMEIAEVVHIDTVNQDTIPDLTKAINKQLDKYMTSLNGQLRKYSR